MEIKRIFYKNRYVLAILFGVVAGSVYANIFRNSNQTSLGIYNSNYLSVYADTTINNYILWTYIVRCRLRDIVLLVLVGLTKLKKPAFLIYIIYIGACIGMLMSAAVMNFGVLGILICLCSMMPQYIFYAGCLWMVYKMLFSDQIIHKKWRIIMVIVLLFLAGTYLEAYINPVLLKFMYVNMY